MVFQVKRIINKIEDHNYELIHMMPPAIVFNCHYNGLSIIQELGRHGVPVYALDSTRSVGTVSRYARYKCSPDPLYDEDGFIQFLIDMGSGFDEKPVLFPTNDHWALAIARHKHVLTQWYIPCVADGTVVELLIKKDLFYQWAMKRNYPVPHLYTKDDILQSTATQPNRSSIFPLIAKPIARRTSNLCTNNSELSNFFDSHRMTIISNKSEYIQFSKKFAGYLDHFLFQKYIPGMADNMYTVGIYANKYHEVLGLFTGRKVRGFPPDIGDCIVGQNDSLPSEIIECVKKMVKELKYSGIAEFEFKKDSSTSEFTLIEINPRSWSWIGITPTCGVSLPWLAYADLSNHQQITYTENSLKGGEIIYIKFFDDLVNSLYLYRKKKYFQYHKRITCWIKDLKGKKKVIAEFSWDDPIIGLYAIFSHIYKKK